MKLPVSFSILLLAVFCSAASAQDDIRKAKKGWADLGVRLEDKKPAVGWTANVMDVTAGSCAAKAGIAAGDRIVAFDGKDDPTSEQIMVALWGMPLDGKVKLKFSHEGATKEIELQPDKIQGQDIAGQNNVVHHPPAIRGVAIEAEKDGDAALPALYAFDLTISFDWRLGDDELAQAKAMVEDAARIWYDAVEGQSIWRKVEIRTAREGWDRAQYRCRKAKRGGFLGIEHVTPGGQCMLNFSALDKTAAWVWVHEAGHMQLGCGDEYPYAKGEKSPCGCLMGGDKHIELCVQKDHDYAMKESCWDNAKRWYPNLARVTGPTAGQVLKRLPEIVVIAPKAPAPEESPKAEKKGRGFLGIQPEELDDADRKALKENGYEAAVKLRCMPGSAAAKGGLKDHDLLAEFDGTKVASVQELAPLVQKCGSGKVVKVVVVREGKKVDLSITLGIHPEDDEKEEDD